MPKRPPTLADRLRDAWRRTGDTAMASAGSQRVRDKGTDFADRLRAAVSTRS